jgi:hypothetical protein
LNVVAGVQLLPKIYPDPSIFPLVHALAVWYLPATGGTMVTGVSGTWRPRDGFGLAAIVVLIAVAVLAGFLLGK